MSYISGVGSGGYRNNYVTSKAAVNPDDNTGSLGMLKYTTSENAYTSEFASKSTFCTPLVSILGAKYNKEITFNPADNSKIISLAKAQIKNTGGINVTDGNAYKIINKALTDYIATWNDNHSKDNKSADSNPDEFLKDLKDDMSYKSGALPVFNSYLEGACVYFKS